MTDEELLHGLRSRNPAALEALADAYTLPVYALVHRVLAGAGTAQDVEECTGDVLYLAWERAGRFDPGRAPLRTWLLMLAKYQALEVRRRLLRETGRTALPEAGYDPLDQPEAALAAREEREAVQQALDQLPPVEKELVYRRYFLNERVDAAAEALGLTRQAADNRLWRARKTLKGLLNWWQKGEVAGDER
ncbi:MAG TPA: sigma-70 family RNA polymerase sigma factor [Symbiobacteriaceae bacterium]|nr:sigma-70 family RNA polymerase sigma factor [Symbiobacteriaceae bacterium]